MEDELLVGFSQTTNKSFVEINTGIYNTSTTGQIDKFFSDLAWNSYNTVSYIFFIFQVFAFIIGIARVYEYKKYSVGREGDGKVSPTLIQWMLKCNDIISILWIFQALLSYKIHPGFPFAFITGSIFWPLLRIVCEYENSHKFSIPSKSREKLCLKNFWICCLILNTSNCVFQIYLWNEISFKEKLILGISLIRSLFISGIIYLGNTGIYKVKKEIKEVDDDEDEEGDEKSLDETLQNISKQWKLMRKHINLSYKAKLCTGACFVLIGLERILRLFSSIVEKNLMDSISNLGTITRTTEGTMTQSNNVSMSANNNGSDTKAELEFRWDLLFIQSLIYLVETELICNLNEFLWEFIKLELNQGTQVKMFRKLQDLSLRWHLEKPCGDILGVLSYGSCYLFWFLQSLFFHNIPQMMDVVIYIIYVATVYPRLLNSVIFITTLASLAIHFVSAQYQLRMKDAQIKADDKKMSEAIDSLVNYETVKYFNNEDHEALKYDAAFTASQRNELKTNMYEKWEQIGQSLVRHLGTFVGSLLCYWMIFNNEGLTVGDYHMFGSHLFRFYYPFMSLSHLHSTFKLAIKDLEKMNSVFEESPEVCDAPNAQELLVPSGDITFQDVHFSYVPEREILKGVTFTVPAGKTFAIVGPTGSGKSTLVRLLFRFFDATSGSILINGQNIQDVKLKSLRKAIGVIPQDTVLFHQSIKSNILYGNLASTNPDEDVMHAAKCACVHETIEKFPEKYETVVGSRGLKLSGGERQRVSIARAVMKDPFILLMDEATSSLDSQTERQIQNTLETVCKNRTTIMIAHRLSTVINADKILVIEDGKIVESGSHTELLNQNGNYAKMWNEQITQKKQD